MHSKSFVHSISIQTPIFHLVLNSMHLQITRYVLWLSPTLQWHEYCSKLTVTNLQVVKIEFVIFLVFLLSSAS